MQKKTAPQNEEQEISTRIKKLEDQIDDIGVLLFFTIQRLPKEDSDFLHKVWKDTFDNSNATSRTENSIE